MSFRVTEQRVEARHFVATGDGNPHLARAAPPQTECIAGRAKQLEDILGPTAESVCGIVPAADDAPVTAAVRLDAPAKEFFRVPCDEPWLRILESTAFDAWKMNGRGGRIRTCKSLRTEGFKPSAYCQFRHAPVMVILTGRLWTPPPLLRGGRWERPDEEWRRRADSNRRIADLQSAPLTTWVRRL